MSEKSIGVDIFQPIVPDYRTALFEGLDSDPDLKVFVQASPASVCGDQAVEMHIKGYDKSIKMHAWLGGRVVWQSGFEFKKAGAPGDVVVVCGDVHQLSSLWMAVKARIKGYGVIWWGHHQSMGARPVFVKLRLAVAKFLSDCYLCYTSQGVKMLTGNGFDPSTTFSTGNTIDTNSINKLRQLWDAHKLKVFKENNQVQNKRILLFCGVLREKVRMDIVFKALKIACRKNPDIVLLVIGSGNMLQSCREQVSELGLNGNVRFLGEIRGQSELAPWFMSSEIFVYGGAIGLSIIHAMAYGLPVIVHEDANLHGPEFEALNSGINGLTFIYDDANDMAKKIIALLNNRKMLSSMKEKTLETVECGYSIDSMISRFKECIETASVISLQRQSKRR